MILLDDLIFKGVYGGLALDALLPEAVADEIVWSTIEYPNGNAVHCNFYFNDLVFSVGLDDEKKITYFNLKLHEQKETMLSFLKDSKSLWEMGFEHLTNELDAINERWEFGHCFSKLLRIKLLQSNAVLTFGFYEDEKGLGVIELVNKKRIDAMHSKYSSLF